MPADKLLAGIERLISPKLDEILEERIDSLESFLRECNGFC